MPVIKVFDNAYATKKDLYNLVNYALLPEHCLCGLYGTQGIIRTDAFNMAQDMYMIKKMYGKTKCRQALHFTISFSELEMQFIKTNTALHIGYEVLGFFVGHQVVFGVHDNEDNLHIHFVVNTTSFKDGKQYAIGPAGLYKLKWEVDNIVRRYMPRVQDPVEAIECLMG